MSWKVNLKRKGESILTPDPLYQVHRAAEILNVGESTIRRMIDSGELPVVRIRRNVRIPESALSRLTRPQVSGLPDYLRLTQEDR
jgi:excisionase family DNA binding protein